MVAGIIALCNCSDGSKNDGGTLADTEVNEYENPSGIPGKSNDGFRENSIKGPQYIEISEYELILTGLVDNSINYTYNQIINEHQHYNKNVTINCVEGWSVSVLWEGLLLRDLIDEAKPRPYANTIILYTYDGYSTSFPIDYVVDNDVLIAHKMNGEILPPERGFPFVLVAESKWGYKWIKWITKIEISDNADYKGFWESFGYSNIGDLDKSFFP